jgi:hypothetical protein
MAYKTFVAGEEALASDVNSYLMSQTVARFASASARTAGIASPVVNQLTMLDTGPGVIQYWNGSAWADLVPSLPATFMRVYRQAAFSLPAGSATTTTIPFDQKSVADPGNLFNLATSEYTVPVNGYYSFFTNLIMGLWNSPQDWCVFIARNGAEYQRGSNYRMTTGTGGDGWGFLVSGAAFFLAGDKLTIKFYSSGPNACNMVTGVSGFNTFSIYRVTTA